MVYESAMLCVSPLTALAAHPTGPLFTVAAADGRLWLYEAAADGRPACREVYALDLDRAVRRLQRPRDRAVAAAASAIARAAATLADGGVAPPSPSVAHSLPPWMTEGSPPPASSSAAAVAGGQSVLSSPARACLAGAGRSDDAERTCSVPLAAHFEVARGEARGRLLVATSTHLLQIDASSFEVEVAEDFQRDEVGVSGAEKADARTRVGTLARAFMASTTGTGHGTAPSPVTGLFIAAFDPTVACTVYVAAGDGAAALPTDEEAFEGVAEQGRNYSHSHRDSRRERGLEGGDAAVSGVLSLFPSPQQPVPSDSALRSDFPCPATAERHRRRSAGSGMSWDSWEKPSPVFFPLRSARFAFVRRPFPLTHLFPWLPDGAEAA